MSMPPGLIGQFIEAQNPYFQQKVTMAMTYVAQSISTEAADTPNHASRAALATQVVRSPQSFAQAFAMLLAAQGANSTSDDGVLRDYVTQVWNTMAGSSGV